MCTLYNHLWKLNNYVNPKKLCNSKKCNWSMCVIRYHFQLHLNAKIQTRGFQGTKLGGPRPTNIFNVFCGSPSIKITYLVVFDAFCPKSLHFCSITGTCVLWCTGNSFVKILVTFWISHYALNLKKLKSKLLKQR
jgi:hypothetical protein